MKKYLIILVALIVSFGIGYYQAPGKVTTVTEMKVETITVEKIKVKTVIKELPSGEKITTIMYQNDKNSKKDLFKKDVKVQEKSKLSYSVSVGPSYAAVGRRMLGNLWLGGYVAVDKHLNPKQYGVYVRYSF